MTSVNVTTQSNTVTVQQGDATTVTIATQGPQGPAGSGSSITINNNGTSKVITGSGTANTLNANTNLFFDGTTLDVKNGTGVIRTGQGTFNGDVTFTGANHNIVFDKSDDRLELADGAEISFGDSEDFKIHYEFNRVLARQHGSGPFVFDLFNQFNFIHITGGQLTDDIAKFIPNGPIELYHDNTKRFSTSGIGATVFGQLDTTSNVAVGSGVTLSPDGDGFYTGIVTATSFVGGLPITNGADNRVITATSASAIQGEAGLTFDGTTLTNAGSGFKGITIAPNTNNSATLRLQNSQANYTVSNITGGSFSIGDGSGTKFTINSSLTPRSFNNLTALNKVI